MIEMGKKYRTRAGKPVVIYDVAIRCGTQSVVGKITSENKDSIVHWFADGRFAFGDSDYDLFEVSEFDELVIDQPVMVRNDINGDWKRRYYAGHKNGLILAWTDGVTSWNADFRASIYTSQWKYWRLPAEDEMNRCTLIIKE